MTVEVYPQDIDDPQAMAQDPTPKQVKEELDPED